MKRRLAAVDPDVTDLARAWIVATVWASFHTERRQEAIALRVLIGSDLGDQLRGLAVGATGPYPPLDTARVLAAIAALEGERLDEFPSESHMGGARWADIQRAGEARGRSEVMQLLGDALMEAHPVLAEDVRAAAHADIIHQLAAVWVVWTHPNVAPPYFATAALTSARSLRCRTRRHLLRLHEDPRTHVGGNASVRFQLGPGVALADRPSPPVVLCLIRKGLAERFSASMIRG